MLQNVLTKGSPASFQGIDMTANDSTTVADSGVAFGTSGARGLVTAMTDRVCYGYTAGFLGYLAEQGEFAPGRAVALAGDLRPSTPRILTACAQAVRDLGGEVVFCGYVPTPALALHAFGQAIPSLMVTGSHNPPDYNGLKMVPARWCRPRPCPPSPTSKTPICSATWTFSARARSLG